MTIPINRLKTEWLKKENHELIEKRRRRYFHFDEILNKISPAVFRKITDPDYIKHHAFLPLLKRIQKDRLYKKDSVTGKKKILPKERPISYAAHFDAAIYSWYAYQLESHYENALRRDNISDSVIAYRKLGRSNLHFAKEVFEHIGKQEHCVAIGIDIMDFYGSLDHRMLKAAWVRLLDRKDLPKDHYKVFRTVTTAATVSVDRIRELLGIGKHDIKKMKLFLGINILDRLRAKSAIEVNSTKKGIPQGTPISCVLSNAYMRGFDLAISTYARQIGGMYRRYSDDIIIVCPKGTEVEAQRILQKEIDKVQLVIQHAKTEIRFFDRIPEGFLRCTDEKGRLARLQYLGVLFDGGRMTLRHKGYAKFGRRMIRAVRREVHRTKELKKHIAKRKLYEQFTPMGDRNYVTYARRAARELHSLSILRSVTLRRLVRKVKQRIRKESIEGR